MSNLIDFKNIPLSIREEKKILIDLDIKFWEQISKWDDDQVKIICDNYSLGTLRGLLKLKCFAEFICMLEISQYEAGLLLHAGIASLNALSKLNPNELNSRFSRLRLSSHINHDNKIGLKKSSVWINKAKNVLK